MRLIETKDAKGLALRFSLATVLFLASGAEPSVAAHPEQDGATQNNPGEALLQTEEAQASAAELGQDTDSPDLGMMRRVAEDVVRQQKKSRFELVKEWGTFALALAGFALGIL